jgi:hypothetical protein
MLETGFGANLYSCPFYHLICENQIKYYKLVKKRKYARPGLIYDKIDVLV